MDLVVPKDLGYNESMTTKEAIQKLVDRLPEDATIEDLQYQLYVLQKIKAGEEDLTSGRTVPHAEILKDLAQWVK